MVDAPEIVVLRRGTEALTAAEYAEEIRDRLPTRDVALASTPCEERNLLRTARIATGIEISTNQVERAENLELFVVASSGTDHLPMELLDNRGVTVVNASGIHAPGIAEQVLGYFLSFSRNIHRGIRQQQNHQWRHYHAHELKRSTVTIVGLGSIGHAITERLAGFDVDTIGIRYTPSKGGPTNQVYGFDDDSVHAALAQTDYLVLCSPLTDTTQELIGDREIDTLSPEAVLVNVGRGPLVKTEALVHALRTGDLRGAALDVTDPEPLPSSHPLWDLDNVILTPHMGGHTPEHWPRLAEILAENIERLDSESGPDRFTNLATR